MVTGGTGALGRAVVQHFVGAGCVVHVPYVAHEEARVLKGNLREAGSLVHLHRCDVTKADEVSGLYGAVRAHGGPVEVLANLVGGFAAGALDETAPDVWARMWQLNATTAFLCAAAALPAMKSARWGRIINVSSAPAVNHGAANLSAYAAAKAAVLNLSESWAKELAPWGITVNAIVPTVIDTEANRASAPGVDRSTWLVPQAVAGVIGFLASEEANIVTGTALNLSRGVPAQSGE